MPDPIEDGVPDEPGLADSGIDGEVITGFVGVEIRLAAGGAHYRVTLSEGEPGRWNYVLENLEAQPCDVPRPAYGQVFAADHHEAGRRVAPLLAGCFLPGTVESKLMDLLPGITG